LATQPIILGHFAKVNIKGRGVLGIIEQEHIFLVCLFLVADTDWRRGRCDLEFG
jgi:hypothetical protein